MHHDIGDTHHENAADYGYASDTPLEQVREEQRQLLAAMSKENQARQEPWWNFFTSSAFFFSLSFILFQLHTGEAIQYYYLRRCASRVCISGKNS